MSKAKIENLIIGGVMLSNCAFNLKHNQNLSAAMRDSLATSQEQWDKALAAFRETDAKKSKKKLRPQ